MKTSSWGKILTSLGKCKFYACLYFSKKGKSLDMGKEENKNNVSVESRLKEIVLTSLFIIFILIFTIHKYEIESDNRIEEKETFLLSENFNQVEIKELEWKERMNDRFNEKGSHDVFLTENQDGDLIEIEVYDLYLNGKYVFKILDNE